jgi:hypothetical protein
LTDRASLRKRLKIEGLRFSGRAARKPGWKTKQDFLCSAHSAYAIQTFKNVGAQAVSLSLDGTNNQRFKGLSSSEGPSPRVHSLHP